MNLQTNTNTKPSITQTKKQPYTKNNKKTNTLTTSLNSLLYPKPNYLLP